jgi:hypothetical protein
MSALGVDAPVRSRRSRAFLSKIRAISAINRAPMSFLSAGEEGSAVPGAAHTHRLAETRRVGRDAATRLSRSAT